MATIVEIKGNLHLKWYDDVKGYSRTKTLNLKATQDNWREAKRLCKKFEADSTKFNELRLVEAIKFDLAFAEFLAENNYKPKTLLIYNKAKEYFLNACGNKYIESYSTHDYAKLLTYFKTAKPVKIKDDKGKEQLIYVEVQQNTKSIYTRCLHHFFNYCLKYKYCKENIIKVLPMQQKAIKLIPKEDRDKILEALKPNPYQYALVKFIMYTGIRISTALDIRWEDIDFKKKIITFRNIKVKGNEFTFPLLTFIEEIFTELGIKEEGKIFPYENNDSIKFFRRVQKKIGLKTIYGIHKFKHTFISTLIDNGISLEECAELTNTTISTLRKYYMQLNKQKIAAKVNNIKW